MIKYHLVLILFLFTALCAVAQASMEYGFKLLEEAKYDSAASYFEDQLEKYPKNKTTHICYGRAIGLGGNAKKALDHFESLKSDYPEDFEVLLNIAEANMWNKQYENASEIYKNLLEIDSLNFVANQGYANALASLKMNSKALVFINKALTIAPLNSGAMLSKKYILLALAEEARNAWQYKSAHQYLDELESMFSNDREGLLNRANIFLSQRNVKGAHKIFDQLVQDSIDLLEGYLGLSYTSLLDSKYKKSLMYAQEANDFYKPINDDPSLDLRIQLNLINSLAINRDFSTANGMLDSLAHNYPNNESIESAVARLKLWNKKPKLSLLGYNQLVEKYGENYEFLLGKAEAFRALKERDSAIVELKKALEIKPSETDGFRLLKELEHNSKSIASYSIQQSSDIGGNNSLDQLFNVEWKPNDKHVPFVRIFNRKAEQENIGIQTDQRKIEIGNKWQLNHKLNGVMSIGQISQDQSESKLMSMVYDLQVQYVPSSQNIFQIELKREKNNYSVDLIKSDITLNSIITSYNYNHPTGFSFYGQHLYTRQSDNNSRNQFFTSFYYRLKDVPSIKFGLNLTSLTFNEMKQELYFSPSKYSVQELFFQTSNSFLFFPRFKYDINLAIGSQRIEKLERQLTSRIQLSIYYPISSDFVLDGRYTYTNTAAATASGYRFTSFGLGLRAFF